MKTALLTGLTMIAFAANSVLARLALAENDIDPAGYTMIRLVAGAIILFLLAQRGGQLKLTKLPGNWTSALALFVYAAGFSFAYVALPTGTGAVILFACVQATMIGWAIFKGDRPRLLEIVGLAIAFGALVWLMSPGIEAPDLLSAMLMVGAGIAWGAYSARGQGGGDPLRASAGNFMRAVPFAVVIMVVFSGGFHATPFGIVMAVISGAITSGLGYALWYSVLKDLSATQGSIVQLSVPAIAAIGGVAFGEALSTRFVMSCALILGGVALAIITGQKRRQSSL